MKNNAPTKRWQKNITVTDEQLEFIKANHGKMTIGQLSKMLGLNSGKVHNHIRLLGLVKPLEAKVIDIGTNGYFDLKKWKKYYEY